MANYQQFLMVQEQHPHIMIIDTIDNYVTDIYGYHPQSFNQNYYYEENSFFHIDDLIEENDKILEITHVSKDNYYFQKIKKLVKEIS